jgi:hypothetical protein
MTRIAKSGAEITREFRLRELWFSVWAHMIAEKLADLFWRAFAQSLSFVSNFLHPDGNLRWTQACD